MLEQSRWEPATHRLAARYAHVPDDGGESIEMRIRQRYLLSGQVGSPLCRAGLETVALLGGFDPSAFDPEESELLVVVAGLAPP